MSNTTDSENKVQGVVLESLPNAHFKVLVQGSTDDSDQSEESEEEQQEIMAYLAGKMRLHRIRVLVGDTVELTLDPYGGKARITRRL